jgi:polyvinyl alcohol dehydrogenase (cytochrome)
MRTGTLLFAAWLIGGLALPAVAGASPRSRWPIWGKDPRNSHFAREEREIGVENASRLAVKWVFHLGRFNDCASVDCSVSATPTVDGRRLYFPDWAGNLYAVDARSGRLAWLRRIEDHTGTPGDFSRTSPTIRDGRLYLGSRRTATIFAVDAETGRRIWKSRPLDDHPDALITAAPVVHDGVVYAGISSLESSRAGDPSYPCCSFRGSVVALDARTGRLRWQTHTIPAPPEGVPPADWFSGAAVWGSSFPIDEERDALYVGTGNNYQVPRELSACVASAGSDAIAVAACLGQLDLEDNFVDSLLSLDLEDGEVHWAAKLQGYDAWNVACAPNATFRENCPVPAGPDFDFGQAPMLWSAKIRGRKRDLVGAGQKSGTFWALDRRTGRVVWSATPGPGSALGGMHWGSATDGRRIYTTDTFSAGFFSNGVWSALDGATGAILWQTRAPGGFGRFLTAPVTLANGVLYGATMNSQGDNMYALDAATGSILWSFASGGSVNAAPSLVDGVLYWPSGYRNNFLGTGNDKLYAFEVPGAPRPRGRDGDEEEGRGDGDGDREEGGGDD